MTGRGGWFKSWDDELDDPKIRRLTDAEYRVWRTCLCLCNRGPARLRERGYLYHSPGFPVEACDIAHVLGRPVDAVEAAIERLCQVGGPSSLMLIEEIDGQKVLRIRAWRKRQRGGEEGDGAGEVGADAGDPEFLPDSSQKPPTLSPPDVRREDVDVRRKTETETCGPTRGQRCVRETRGPEEVEAGVGCGEGGVVCAAAPTAGDTPAPPAAARQALPPPDPAPAPPEAIDPEVGAAGEPDAERESAARAQTARPRTARRTAGQPEAGRSQATQPETAPPRPTWPAEAEALRAIPGYPFDERKDRALMDALAATYSGLDLAKEIRKLHSWLVAHGMLPLRGQAGPRARVRRWMEHADRFAARDAITGRPGGADQAARGTPRGRPPVRRAEDFRETGEVAL